MTEFADHPQRSLLAITQSLTNMGMDWSRLHELSAGYSDFELELLTIFVDDTQAHIEAIKQAITVNDFAALAAEAHHVKGASANIGATPMTTLAIHIEDQAYHQTTEGLKADVPQLQGWLTLFRDYITASRLTETPSAETKR